MQITEVKKKNGTTVYRANVYLGVDQVTGKKAKTSVTGGQEKRSSGKKSTRKMILYRTVVR
jgi:integrase family protein